MYRLIFGAPRIVTKNIKKLHFRNAGYAKAPRRHLLHLLGCADQYGQDVMLWPAHPPRLFSKMHDLSDM